MSQHHPNKRLPNRLRILRTEAGLTQDRLGKHIGTTGQTIARLETGARRLTQEWIEKISAALGCQAGEVFWPDESDMPRRPALAVAPVQPARQLLDGTGVTRPGLPVYDCVETTGGLTLRPDIVDRTWMPPPLQTALNAFAFYMRGLSAMPVYGPGDLLMINPVQAVKPGDHVLFLRQDLTLGPSDACLADLVAIEADEWRVASFAPRRDHALAKPDWPIAWKIAVKVRS